MSVPWSNLRQERMPSKTLTRLTVQFASSRPIALRVAAISSVVGISRHIPSTFRQDLIVHGVPSVLGEMNALNQVRRQLRMREGTALTLHSTPPTNRWCK